jgi:hypothetical protein
MTTTYKPYTIDELVTMIYEQNQIHFDFDEDLTGGKCDCALHNTMNTIMFYWENNVD